MHFDFELYELSALQCITEITFQIPKVVVHVYTSILFSIDASPQLWHGKISLFITILQFQKYNKQNQKKNAKRFDPSTKSSSQCFFSHLEDLGSMLKYWLLPNPRHPFDSGLTFAMVWCPWATQTQKLGVENLRWTFSVSSFLFFWHWKNESVACFCWCYEVVTLFVSLLPFSCEPKNKVQKKCTAWANNMLAWKTFHQVVIYQNWKMTSLSKQHNQGQEQHHLSLILIIAKIRWGVSLSSNVSLLLPIIFVVDLSLPASRDSSN